jgi:hypothetical protein
LVVGEKGLEKVQLEPVGVRLELAKPDLSKPVSPASVLPRLVYPLPSKPPKPQEEDD